MCEEPCARSRVSSRTGGGDEVAWNGRVEQVGGWCRSPVGGKPKYLLHGSLSV
jgi:hypothetical protein